MKGLTSLLLLSFLNLRAQAGILINNGLPAINNQFPSVVKVTLNNEGEYGYEETIGYCTGTLIAPDIVLTAGHCAYQKKDEFIQRVSLPGSLTGVTTNPWMLGVKVKKTIIHPRTVEANKQIGNKYIVEATKYDIAFLQLKKPLPIKESDISTIGCKNQLVNDTAVAIVGYGKRNTLDSTENTNPKGELYFGENLIALTSKNSIYELDIKDDDQLTNSGDSGGPLFIENDQKVIYGIDSAGESSYRGQVVKSYFTNLSSPEIKTIFRDLVKSSDTPKNLKKILSNCL